MSFVEDLDRDLQAIERTTSHEKAMLERFKAEVEFATRLAAAYPEQQAAWEGLIAQATASLKAAMAQGTPAAQAVPAAEAIMAPLGEVAKTYTVHCVGHAHIDMNWLWNWPETVATVNDTFTTVDRLMSEFPTLRFSQSQTSIYQIMKDYLPELTARVKERVQSGQWEITANQWVEGSKNLASGEILCRHLLYTKRFFQQEYGLPYDAIKVNFEPDTFGHAHTIPSILSKAGVRWYYFCRAGKDKRLFWWQGPDGSRVLAIDDHWRWYLGPLEPTLTQHLFEFEQSTGLKDHLFVYGIGDHGGGPTRQDLVFAVTIDTWPIFPHIKLSTFAEFFTIAEQQAKDLPVIDDELNFIFEGCYTSQSNVKRANRKGENALVEAEICALLGKSLAGMPYPADGLFTGWRNTMFNQFHDILPGSGIHATYEYAQGIFQETLAQTSMIKTRALRMIANQVNTAAVCPCALPGEAGPGAHVGPGIGAGPGESGGEGAISRYGAGGVCCDAFVVFNPSPWVRSAAQPLRIWNRDWPHDKIVVQDDAGNTYPAQVLGAAPGWGASYIDIAVPAMQIDGLGYRTFSVARAAKPATSGEKMPACSAVLQHVAHPVESIFYSATTDTHAVLENEYFTVVVEQASAAIIHLIDKRTGRDFVPVGGKLGLLEYYLETPHGMTAWVIGQIAKVVPFTEGWKLELGQKGPFLATVKATRTFQDSTFTMTIALGAGVPRVDFTLEVNWLERGSAETGVPMLRAAFPVAISDVTATFEIPNGAIVRPANNQEVPSLKWADLSGAQDGARVGITLLNEGKYGHSAKDNVLRLTLLRSSYDPDPLPELGKHTIKFAVAPHIGDCSVSDATRAGYDFNAPLNAVNTTQHDGSLPVRNGFAEILTSNVMLSGMKKAEDADALVIRLYEVEGQATTARVKFDAALVPANAPAVETDLLEQPLAQNTAKMDGDILTVTLPAHGMVTVKIG